MDSSQFDSKFFSVLLPVYNAVKYVEKTIESVLNQTFRDFELIIVDDGSNDGSMGICQKVAKQYSNIIYLRQSNGGICDARNKAISIAHGKYIVFCDHDDLMHPDALKELHDVLAKKEYDVVKYSYKCIVEKERVKLKEYDIKCSGEVSDSEKLKCDYDDFNNFVYTVWNGAYKTAVIKRLKLQFDRSIKFGMEDVVFNLTLLKARVSVSFVEKCLYNHYIRYGQSTSRKYDANKMESICRSIELENEYFGEIEDPQVKIKISSKYIRSFFVSACLGQLDFKRNENKAILERFSKAVNYSLSYSDFLKYCFVYPKDVIKIFLFRMKMYKVLMIMLKGQ